MVCARLALSGIRTAGKSTVCGWITAGIPLFYLVEHALRRSGFCEGRLHGTAHRSFRFAAGVRAAFELFLWSNVCFWSAATRPDG